MGLVSVFFPLFLCAIVTVGSKGSNSVFRRVDVNYGGSSGYGRMYM